MSKNHVKLTRIKILDIKYEELMSQALNVDFDEGDYFLLYSHIKTGKHLMKNLIAIYKIDNDNNTNKLFKSYEFEIGNYDFSKNRHHPEIEFDVNFGQNLVFSIPLSDFSGLSVKNEKITSNEFDEKYRFTKTLNGGFWSEIVNTLNKCMEQEKQNLNNDVLCGYKYTTRKLKNLSNPMLKFNNGITKIIDTYAKDYRYEIGNYFLKFGVSNSSLNIDNFGTSMNNGHSRQTTKIFINNNPKIRKHFGPWIINNRNISSLNLENKKIYGGVDNFIYLICASCLIAIICFIVVIVVKLIVVRNSASNFQKILK